MTKIAILGLGEAGSHFANDLAALGVSVSGWDPNPLRPLHPAVRFAADNPDAVKGADIVFSVNLTAASRAVAREVTPFLSPGALYCEMNTSSPATKIEIAGIVAPAGVRFVDLAIMAPVPPQGMQVPLLASGAGAAPLAETLAPYSLNLRVLNDNAGDAAARKLLRSIVYKGVAAVICEAMEAGARFGLEDYIRAQIHSVIGQDDALIDRFVEGSRTHAARRIHEMEAVSDMLEEAGLNAFMSRAAGENLKKYT